MNGYVVHDMISTWFREGFVCSYWRHIFHQITIKLCCFVKGSPPIILLGYRINSGSKFWFSSKLNEDHMYSWKVLTFAAMLFICVEDHCIMILKYINIFSKKTQSSVWTRIKYYNPQSLKHVESSINMIKTTLTIEDQIQYISRILGMSSDHEN